MKLYEEAYSEQKKKSKIPVIIGINIAFLVSITVTIIYLIVYLQSTVLRINLDGANASKLEELLIIEENEGNTDIEKAADYVIYIPKTNPYFTNSLAIIPLQLFAYYISIGRGCDVDKPRNLAKSVTVE